MAGGAPERRRRVPAERRLLRRARAGRKRHRSRGGCARVLRLRRRRSESTRLRRGCACARLGSRPRASLAHGRGLGADVPRRGARLDPPARAGPPAGGGRGLHGRRSRGRSLPPRRLPLQPFLDRDLGQPALAGAEARRRVGNALRPPSVAHPRMAFALLPAPARLRGGPRGHRARARAREWNRRPLRDGAGALPGLARRRATGPLGSVAYARGAGQDALRGDRPTRRTSASS